MPITSTLGTLANRLLVKVNRITSPELARRLGQELALDITDAYFMSGMSEQTGNTVDALSYVGEPEKTAFGSRIGVVGDKKRIGDPSEASPKGTIRAFLEWYNEQPNLPKHFIKGGIPSPYAWRMLSDIQKQTLQKEREAGRFGGETAAGVGRVPYVWGHEQGNPMAAILGRHFIQDGRNKWKARVSSIISDWYRRG